MNDYPKVFPDSLIEILRSARQIVVLTGAGTVVQPAASLPLIAHRRGATVVEINPALTPITDRADFAFQAPSGTVLPALCEAVWGSPRQ